jgi:proteasome lid subunit RPN8/RPN11
MATFGHYNKSMTMEISMMAANEDTSFIPLGVVDEPVRREARTRARVGYVVYSGAAGFEVAIPELVVERMLAFGRQASPREWYGLVIGRLYEDEVGRHVVVVGIVPDPEADANRGFVQTSFDSELRTRLSARQLFPDGIPIGWVHGHVRYGARYSSTDFRNQATWTRSHSIGIVVDPFCEPNLGVYRGPEGELLKLVPKTAMATPPFGQSMDVRAALSAPTSTAAVPRERHIWSFISTVAALVAFVAATILWARVGRLHEEAAGLQGRVERVEQRQQESSMPQRMPPPAGAGEMSQIGFVGADNGASICVGP